ncbi:MAG: hypothetical protein KGD60_07425 [Candidatus Thorarchaeota archaeon]|nr:hypothetical protein [Candidatus Thorarchaeota archaeon]
MTLLIGQEWNLLFTNNPKIHAFAVAKDGAIIWQTENWNLVEEIDGILKAADKDASKVSTGGVTYKLVTSSDDSYIATADDDKGHLILVLIDENSWAIAFAAPTAVPELAVIDIKKTAIQLRGHM